MEKLSAWQLAKAVVSAATPFNLRKNEGVIQNVSYGMFRWGEADIIALTKSGYMIEGEIKISKEDLKADLKKSKWNDLYSHWIKDIKDFYYIVPEYLEKEALELTNRAVISVSVTGTHGYRAKIVRQTQAGGGRKLFLEERNQLLRLGCFRAWKEVHNGTN